MNKGWFDQGHRRANSVMQQERFDVFVREFNAERPHEALDMKCPAELYVA